MLRAGRLRERLFIVPRARQREKLLFAAQAGSFASSLVEHVEFPALAYFFEGTPIGKLSGCVTHSGIHFLILLAPVT